METSCIKLPQTLSGRVTQQDCNLREMQSPQEHVEMLMEKQKKHNPQNNKTKTKQRGVKETANMQGSSAVRKWKRPLVLKLLLLIMFILFVLFCFVLHL